jgi:hypothetical protein
MDAIDNLKGGIPNTHKYQHKNSMKSFKELSAGSRHLLIVKLCQQEARPLTDREIMKGLGFCDLNSVRPRISELIDFKILYESGSTRDSDTGKTVRLVRVSGGQQLELF